MKCPKCSLVTFDHLAKCPKCGQSFHLQRHLTQRAAVRKRRIPLPGAGPTDPAPRTESTVDRHGPVAAGQPRPQRTPTPVESPPDPQTAHASAPPAEPQQAPLRRTIFGANHAAQEAPAAEVAEAPDEPEVVDPQAADAARLKQRMVLASQARRRAGPDATNETVDPALPDWYDPAVADEDDRTDEPAVTGLPVKR